MEKTRNNMSFGEGNISKLMFRFSLPCVLSLLVSAFYNIVDQIFIGNSELSTLGNAATGVVFPVFIIAQAFAWCFESGCAAYLNICQGKKQTENSHKIIGTGITVTIMVSFILMAVFFPLRTQILYLCGATENSIGMAEEYFNIIMAFYPFFLFSNMINGILRADGSPGISMISMLSGAAVNIILDPVFIFGFKWGMTGAALATVLGQVVTSVICIIYLIKPKTFRLHLRSFIPDFKLFLNALKLGVSSFITQITILVVTVVSNSMFAKYGMMSHYGADIPIAVFGITNKIFVVVINTVVGVVLGCQPVVSYNMGAKKYDRVKELYKKILLLNTAVGIIATLVFELAPDALIKLFGTPANIPNPADYWVFARLTLRIYLMFTIFNCVVKTNAIFFQSCGQPVRSIITSTIRDIVCFIPLIVIFPVFFGVEGILYASPVADFVAFSVSSVLMFNFMKKIDKYEFS